MMREKFLVCLSAALICLLLSAPGCAPTAKEPVITKPIPIPIPPAVKEPKVTKPEPQKPGLEPPKEQKEAVVLALKFEPGQKTKYKVVKEEKRKVEFQGSLAKQSDLKGGETGDEIEMTFTQQI